MTEGDFRTAYHGGLWWVERFQDGAWTTSGGPYRLRSSAESRIQRDQKRQEEQKQ